MFTAGNKRPGTTKRQVRALETRIRRRVGDRRGFTLIEAGMTTVIIAVAVLAVMASFGAYGTQYSVEVLARGLAKVEYKGLDLSHLT